MIINKILINKKTMLVIMKNIFIFFSLVFNLVIISNYKYASYWCSYLANWVNHLWVFIDTKSNRMCIGKIPKISKIGLM